MFRALQKMGAAAVPCNMAILGATLAGESLASLRAGMGVCANLWIAFAKLILQPLVACCIAIFASQIFELEAEQYEDAFWLAAIVVACTPTSNSLLVMATTLETEEEAGGDRLTPASVVAGAMMMQ